jgi:hypothetical protein
MKEIVARIMEISKPNPLGWLYKVDKLGKIEKNTCLTLKSISTKISHISHLHVLES